MKTTWKFISYLSVTALLFLFTLNVNAQKVELGFRYMPTVSSFEMKTTDGGTVKGEAILGYGIGALLGFNVTNHLEFQGEVIYNSISQKYKESNVEREINLKYINVPLLLSLNTGKTNRFNLNAVVGPQLGFNVGSSVHTTGGDGTTTATAVLSVKQSDIGFAYGAGMDFGIFTKLKRCVSV